MQWAEETERQREGPIGYEFLLREVTGAVRFAQRSQYISSYPKLDGF